MIKCLAIDDEPLALRQLANYIRKMPFLEMAGECQNALQAKKILENEMIDAIFIDINMPDFNGMDFVKSLNAPPIVVFTTAYSEYAVEGYKVDAVDYLLKPYGLDDFKRAANKVKKAYESLQHTAEPTPVGQPLPEATVSMREEGRKDDGGVLYFKTEHRIVRVSVPDIRYVEGMSEYLKIYIEGQKPLVVLLSMKKLEDRLPSSSFMRIHRSYIINLNKIREVNKNRVILDEETYLPIGDLYKETFSKYLNDKFLGK